MDDWRERKSSAEGTRGKRLVVLVGQKRALAMAVKGKQAERRWSKLREWLST